VSLSASEQRVVDEVERRSDELVKLTSDLISFDTTAREPDVPARDEALLQEYLATRLRKAGAEVDLWEPAPEDVAGSPLAPPGVRFDGRPQLAARFPGTGGGRSLLLNGHIDVVSVEPRERWSSDPHLADVREGRLYGRGSCDMKGGVAAMTFAAEILASLGLRLAGDLMVCTVTDEESTGIGGLAAVARGVSADAGLVTEPSGLDAWVACRGSLMPTITVPGRPGHAGVGQPHWREGGAVNAIEKAQIVINALRRFEEEWRARRDHHHPHLSPGDVVPTVISGGEWMVSYPSSCRIVYHVAYLPAHADENGWGSKVEQEIVDWLEVAAREDDWLSENPLMLEWAPEVPSSEVPPDHPIVETALAAGADVGRPGRVTGMDSWHDGATFTRFGETPSICFGPGELALAHTIDESVAVADLVSGAQALAVAALRFCGDG
jgi:acetylornithine deacetylase